MTYRHRDLLGLQTARSLSDLRSQFNRSALDLGFLGLAERAQPRSARDFGDHSTPHFPWSNSIEFYGTRTPDYIDALTQAFDTADPLEVIIRRRWEKQRRAPFLLSQQPRAFDDNKTWLHLRVDFGEPAYRDALVVPIQTVVQREPPRGVSQVHLIMLTHRVQEARMVSALESMEASTCIEGPVTRIRVEHFESD